MAAAMGEIEDKLAELRQTFRSGITKSGAWRKNQLRALIELLQDNEDKIFKALHQDLGKHPVETYRDEASLLIIIINIYWYYSFLMYHNFNLRFFLLITLMQIGLIKKSAKYALSCLDKWMAPKKVSVTTFYPFFIFNFQWMQMQLHHTKLWNRNDTHRTLARWGEKCTS